MAQSSVKVFISYVREDYPVAKRLYDELKRIGVQPWLDTEELLPGEQWEVEIKRAISKCTILSWNAISGQGYALRELGLALKLLDEFPDRNVFIIPARIEQCESSNRRLRRLHWVDLFPSFEDGFERICKVLHGAGEYVKPVLLEVFDVKWIGKGSVAETKRKTASRDAEGYPTGHNS